MRRRLMAVVAGTVVLVAAPATAAEAPTQKGPVVERPQGCSKTYSRATFHKVARKVYRRYGISEHERQTIKRVMKCQASAKSRRVVSRIHRPRYKRAYNRRFVWEIRWAKVDQGLKNTLAGIAACESGGSPTATSDNGLYLGKYQFDLQTWGSVGGRGDPRNASEREQDVRAAWLYRSRGAQPWPVCGR